MTFKETLHQIVKWVKQDGRVTYRALKRQFELDDEYLDDLKDAIMYSHPVSDDGKGLIWEGNDEAQEQGGTSPLASEIQPSTPGERRQLTVMFCDLAGSTALSQKLDPEDLRNVIRQYQTIAADAVGRFDGYVAQFLGDGLLVYFGWPRAHEDDPARAVYGGLAIVDRLHSELNPSLNEQYGLKLSVRIGIHTGQVVVGQMGSGGRLENLATGETVNIAARLEGLAEPNTIIISSSTQRLVRNAFTLSNLGLQKLKGVNELINLYSVEGIRDFQPDPVRGDGHKKSFLVGRDEEIGLLQRRWNQSKEGLGQVVLVGGAAGIGKSILVDTLRMQVRDEGLDCISFHCASYHQNSAFYPVISRIEKLLKFDHDQIEANRQSLYKQHFAGSPLMHAVQRRAIFALLSISDDSTEQEPEISSQKLKLDALDALTEWLEWESRKAPILIVWEDLHWADPSTLELIGLLIEQSPTLPILTILTYRPEFELPWRRRSHITSLTLNRLDGPQTEALIAHLANGKELPEEVVSHIIDKTDGVPLFVEELTKMLLSSDLLEEESSRYTLKGSLFTLSIPDTLQDSLMARLDQLNTAKEIAQLGSVIGREFKYPLLRAICSQDNETLHSGIKQLVDAELLYTRGRIPRSTYIFKHALIQDAAYSSLLKSQRQKLHLSIATSLKADFEDIRLNQPELIAKHYSEAEQNDKASDYWLEAGRFARQRSSHAEAIAHFKAGLKAVGKLPKGDDRNLRELNMRVGLVPSLIALKGYAAEEVGEFLTKARALCSPTEVSSHLFPILWGLNSYHFVGARHHSSREVGEEILALAEVDKNPVHYTLARHCLGMAEHCLANFNVAAEHMRKGIAHYKSEHHKSHIAHFGVDFGIFIRGFAAQTFWITGYPAEALRVSNESLALAHTVDHPFSLSMAYGYAATFSQLSGDVEATFNTANKAVEISEENQFAYYGAWGRLMRAWAHAMQEDYVRSEEDLRIGFEGVEKTGTKRSKPYFLGILAQVRSKQFGMEEGLKIINDALELAEKLQEPWGVSELHRLKGEMYMQIADREREAEQEFNSALEIAGSQGAGSYVLRSAVSMANLWRRQNKSRDAHALLKSIYDSFEEGFDTPDLEKAYQLTKMLDSEAT